MYKTIAIHTRSTYWTHVETNEESSVVDADDLAKEIEIQSNKFADDGYEVISINPITSGSFANGNGYVHTESVVITARLVKK
ncbi:MAG: hypothetical protein RBT19_10140 [Tenuifilaceae bacterium]|jgi:hypothetical protein|uniref:hypothetical protein n=1 Tax=Perlabentimonas gracilis TaxID=2715279 RepID=UPI00140D3216|nr:hypothetical protein [Perlabentimonas gracilis]MDX9770715.1 hypothetical protein [Tenuifilaceae bacterium]NHB70260.1 hypothetical protein [Perlabentimonas gracilis]